jgi:hypothetical protein
LHNKEHMRTLLVAINGNLHLPARFAQFTQVCKVLGVVPQKTAPQKTSS